MSQLKKGFSYLYFLLLVVVTAALIGSFSRVLISEQKNIDADFKKLQAHYYARSAIKYYQQNPGLPDNQEMAKLNISALSALPGVTKKMKYGGFKIIKNNDTIFFLGYTGSSPENRTAADILLLKEGQYKKWQP